MGKRFDTLLFPGGLKKAFTLSYDDGVEQDKRLIEIFDRYRVKGTFNLGYGVLGHKPQGPFKADKVETHEVKELYRNHEVAGHGLYHSDLSCLGEPYMMYEIIEDKMQLERLVEKPLKMFAYPFGLFNDKVKDGLKKAGYKGARTVLSTHGFDLPKDTLEWNPTCHHNDERLSELLQQFVNSHSMKAQLFYLWGHAYEFDRDNNWNVIEEALKYIDANREGIWFASNGQILDYLQAYDMLEYSVDGSMIYNPSVLDVEIATSFENREILKSGTITRIKETSL